MTSRKSNRTSLAILASLVLGAGGLAGCSDPDIDEVNVQPRTYHLISIVDIEVVRTVDGEAVDTDRPVAFSSLDVVP